MRHYEIVLIIHPDSFEHISNLINRYTDMIVNSEGRVHRVENWGKRQLAYSIKKLSKAYYILLNIEVSQSIINTLTNDFCFNDIILRNIIIRNKYSVTDPSPMIKKKEDNLDQHISDCFS